MSTTSQSDDRTKHAIGSQCGTGIYRCCCCQEFEVIVTGPEDQLPPCKNCGAGDHVQYQAVDGDAQQSHGVADD